MISLKHCSFKGMEKRWSFWVGLEGVNLVPIWVRVVWVSEGDIGKSL